MRRTPTCLLSLLVVVVVLVVLVVPPPQVDAFSLRQWALRRRQSVATNREEAVAVASNNPHNNNKKNGNPLIMTTKPTTTSTASISCIDTTRLHMVPSQNEPDEDLLTNSDMDAKTDDNNDSNNVNKKKGGLGLGGTLLLAAAGLGLAAEAQTVAEMVLVGGVSAAAWQVGLEALQGKYPHLGKRHRRGRNAVEQQDDDDVIDELSATQGLALESTVPTKAATTAAYLATNSAIVEDDLDWELQVEQALAAATTELTKVEATENTMDIEQPEPVFQVTREEVETEPVLNAKVEAEPVSQPVLTTTTAEAVENEIKSETPPVLTMTTTTAAAVPTETETKTAVVAPTETFVAKMPQLSIPAMEEVFAPVVAASTKPTPLLLSKTVQPDEPQASFYESTVVAPPKRTVVTVPKKETVQKKETTVEVPTRTIARVPTSQASSSQTSDEPAPTKETVTLSSTEAAAMTSPTKVSESSPTTKETTVVSTQSMAPVATKTTQTIATAAQKAAPRTQQLVRRKPINKKPEIAQGMTGMYQAAMARGRLNKHLLSNANRTPSSAFEVAPVPAKKEDSFKEVIAQKAAEAAAASSSTNSAATPAKKMTYATALAASSVDEMADQESPSEPAPKQPYSRTANRWARLDLH